MESAIAIIIAAAIALGVALFLGYRMRQEEEVLVLGGLTLVAILICVGMLAGGYYLLNRAGGWIGLISGIVTTTIFWGYGFSMAAEVPRSGRVAAGMWFGYCALSIFGYLAGGWMGLLTLTLFGVLLFWIELDRLSIHLLPLHDKKDKSERLKAFRCLMSFTAGTNYPFYVVDEQSQPVKRVAGNQFLKFFAGPGLVMTDCDHAVYITDGVNVKGVFEPGLAFTGKYDMEPRIIDLRPQLRAFKVEALTKDGIPIEVVTFVPYRIDSGNQPIELGQPVPFRQAAVYQALASEVIARKADKKDHDSGKKYKWDGGPDDGLVPLLVTPIVQDIISHYNLDDLCASFDREKDPRVEIAAEVRTRAKEMLRPYGLEMIGGGISNLLPKDDSITERRVDTWRTKWMRQILVQISQSYADRNNQLELARAKTEIDMIRSFKDIIQSRGRNDINLTLILGLIDSISDVVSQREDQRAKPSLKIEAMLKHLRGEINLDLIKRLEHNG